MASLSDDHSVFRFVPPTKRDGEVPQPTAFDISDAIASTSGGMSVFWLEYFSGPDPVAALRSDVAKSLQVRASSRLAQIPVGACRARLAGLVPSVQSLWVHDPGESLSHSLVRLANGTAGHDPVLIQQEIAESVTCCIPAMFP